MLPSIVKRGKFREILANVIEEKKIETVVLGSSAGGTGVVTAEFIRELAAEIHSQNDVEFIVLDQGDIVNTFKR